MHVPLQLLLLFQNEAVVFEAAVATAKNFHLIVPLIVTVQDGFDEVWLPVGDVKKEAIVFQNSLNLVSSDHALIVSRKQVQQPYLLHVSSAVLQSLFWRTPRATENHSIECALIKSNVDAAGLDVLHVPDVSILPLDTFLSLMTGLHQFYDDS